MSSAAWCLPPVSLLMKITPQEEVPQHVDLDSVAPHMGNKTAVFPAKVLNLLCRRSLKQRQWDLKENSINLALRSNLPHMPSELVLVSSDK